MSEQKNSQDLGQQAAETMGAAGNKLNNSKAGRAGKKVMKKAMKKVLKKLAKLLAKVIVKIVLAIVKALIVTIGPLGLLIILAIILVLIVAGAIVKFFDWFSLGGERDESQELFDNTFAEVIKEEHNKIASPLGGELYFPSDVVANNAGLNSSDVNVSSSWVNNVVKQMTPSFSLTAAGFANHVILDGDNWHKDYKGVDHEDPATKRKMKEDIKDKMNYYFNDSALKLNISYSTESGETVTTKKKEVCEITTVEEIVITEEVPVEVTKTRPIEVEKLVPKRVQRQVQIPCPIFPGGISIEGPCFMTITETIYVKEIVIEYEEYTEIEYRTETRTEYKTSTEIETNHIDPVTTSLPSRQIPTSASAIYLSGTIPYKYTETPYREVSVVEEGNCTVYTSKKYKVKVADDSSPINVNGDGAQIKSYLTSTMPEGDKTKLIREKDFEFFLEMINGMDSSLPTVDSDSYDGSFNIGVPSPGTPIPISDGIFTTPTQGVITTNFGNDILNGQARYHYGMDISKHGTVPIVAAADGTVSRSHYSSSYGNVVYIKHNIEGTQMETVYAHMSVRYVSDGQTVSKGQQIGLQGNTGYSFGQHLHFELHIPSWNSSKSNAVNPRNYVPF